MEILLEVFGGQKPTKTKNILIFFGGRKASLVISKSFKAAGFCVKECYNADCSASDLKEAGFSAADAKRAGFSAADIFPLCKYKRREGAQGVFKNSIASEFGTLYKDPIHSWAWRPNGRGGNVYDDRECRVLEW